MRSNFTWRISLLLGMCFFCTSGGSAEDTDPDPSLLPVLQKMLCENPQQGDTWRLIGRIYRSRGDEEQAVDAFRKALSIQDDNAAAHFDLGQLLYDTGNEKEAATHFQMVMRFAPESGYADQLVESGRVQRTSGMTTSGLEITENEQSFIRQVGYEIQTFDGADDLEQRLHQLDLQSPKSDRDYRFFMEFGTLYNTNVSLTPISRELRSDDSASAQAFLNPDLQWITLRKDSVRAGVLARGSFTLNERHQNNFDLASFQPGIFVEGDLHGPGQNQLIGRLDYVYSIDLLGGSRFGDRHSLTGSTTFIDAEANVLYVYLTGSMSDFNNDGMVPAVNSLDGLSLMGGVSSFFSTNLQSLPTWSLGADVEFADTDGADFRYTGVNLHTNATIQMSDSLSFTPSTGVGYRDYYDFTGSPNRDELTWRINGKLTWQCTEHWAISGVAGYNRFATDNANFDAERIEGGFVFTVVY